MHYKVSLPVHSYGGLLKALQQLPDIFSLMMHCTTYNDPAVIMNAKNQNYIQQQLRQLMEKKNPLMAIKQKYHLSLLGAQGWKPERSINVNNHSAIALFLIFLSFVSYTCSLGLNNHSLLAKYRGWAAHLP